MATISYDEVPSIPTETLWDIWESVNFEELIYKIPGQKSGSAWKVYFDEQFVGILASNEYSGYGIENNLFENCQFTSAASHLTYHTPSMVSGAPASDPEFGRQWWRRRIIEEIISEFGYVVPEIPSSAWTWGNEWRKSA